MKDAIKRKYNWDQAGLDTAWVGEKGIKASINRMGAEDAQKQIKSSLTVSSVDETNLN